MFESKTSLSEWNERFLAYRRLRTMLLFSLPAFEGLSMFLLGGDRRCLTVGSLSEHSERFLAEWRLNVYI